MVYKSKEECNPAIKMVHSGSRGEGGGGRAGSGGGLGPLWVGPLLCLVRKREVLDTEWLKPCRDSDLRKARNYQFWKTINQEAEKVGIKIHDSWEYFMEHKDSTDMRWSHIDYHPNCKAHKIMADYFIKYNLVEK